MSPELKNLVRALNVVAPAVGDVLALAIRADIEKAYREGLKDGYETAKGIYDHTGRAA